MTKILIVEDEPCVRDNICRLLAVAGFTPLVAENGLTGIRLLQAERPALIICDVMMPELDGYEMLAQVRQDPALALIPFIFLTAKVDRYDQRKGMNLGADDYLTKPFKAQELYEAIQVRLEKYATIQKQYQEEQSAQLATTIQALERIKGMTRKDSGPWLAANEALQSLQDRFS